MIIQLIYHHATCCVVRERVEDRGQGRWQTDSSVLSLSPGLARPHGLMASSPLPAPGTNLLLSHSLSLSGPGLSPPPLTRPLSPRSRSEAGVSRPGPGPPHTASASLSYSRLVLPRPGKQISTNCCNLNIINLRKAEKGCFRRNVTRGHCSSDANIQWRS